MSSLWNRSVAALGIILAISLLGGLLFDVTAALDANSAADTHFRQLHTTSCASIDGAMERVNDRCANY